jgi:hypothetical protein
MRASAKKAVSLITNDSDDEAGGDQVQQHSVLLHSSTADNPLMLVFLSVVQFGSFAF